MSRVTRSAWPLFLVGACNVRVWSCDQRSKMSRPRQSLNGPSFDADGGHPKISNETTSKTYSHHLNITQSGPLHIKVKDLKSCSGFSNSDQMTFVPPTLILRSRPCLRNLPIFKSTSQSFSTSCTRHEESTAVKPSTKTPKRPVPPPLPFVPDVQTFLTLFGRKLSQHASKIPSWEALFSMSAAEMRTAGIEPPRNRRYLLWARERFRQGLHGIGGDFKHVKDGVGFVQVLEVDAPGRLPKAQEALPAALKTPGKKAIVVNVPHDSITPDVPLDNAKPVAHIKWLPQYRAIKGTHVFPLKGTEGRRAKLQITEGLWEQKRGVVKDGGERRQAEVRAKRKAKENKEARAAAQ